MTKAEILDSLSHLGAFEAIEQLAGMLSLAIETGKSRKQIKPITDAMRSIERDLEAWSETEQAKAKRAALALAQWEGAQ